MKGTDDMNYFYKIPSDEIDLFEVDFRRILVKFCLARYTNIERITFTSVSLICQKCGYSNDRHANSFGSYVRKTLHELIESNEITQVYGDDIKKSGNSIIGFALQDKFFTNNSQRFCKLTYSAFDILMSIKCPVTTATLLKVYTYIRSGIVETEEQAYGFYGSIKLASRILGLNRKTVDVCLDAFVENGLFIKHSTGSCYVNGEPRNVPNIYVLPDDKANENIDALIIELKNKYKVDEFAPVLGAGQENSNYEKGETNK